MCIRDRYQRRVRGLSSNVNMNSQPLDAANRSNQDNFHKTTKCPGHLVADEDTGCCGCCGVQTGTTIIVILSVICSVLNIVALAIGKDLSSMVFVEQSPNYVGPDCDYNGPSGFQYFQLFTNLLLTAALLFGAVRRHVLTLVVASWVTAILTALFFLAVVILGPSFMESGYDRCNIAFWLDHHPDQKQTYVTVQYISAVGMAFLGLMLNLWLCKVILSYAHYLQGGTYTSVTMDDKVVTPHTHTHTTMEMMV
eukprot:TRINITY_DN1967_c0_g1_i12.p1 TRINITY_DN1967_c0_g1~~TRINITY_DN1967_c0_g1_i12.p1  ORF type:complete len:252 (+),score=65.24 TRINITY_DN1967_c0_g1_i12:192-947(+)